MYVFRLGNIRVYSTALILIGIFIAIPYIGLIRKLKIGDFFEAEISEKEFANIRSNLPFCADVSQLDSEQPNPINLEITRLFQHDVQLGCAKLRIETESILTLMDSRLNSASQQHRPGPLNQLIRRLIANDVISPDLANSLGDVIGVANRAIHDEVVRRQDAVEIGDLGIEILERLQHLFRHHVIDPVSIEIIGNDELEGWMEARYRITTVIPLVENPSINVRIIDQEEFDDFLDGYDESTATPTWLS